MGPTELCRPLVVRNHRLARRPKLSHPDTAPPAPLREALPAASRPGQLSRGLLLAPACSGGSLGPELKGQGPWLAVRPPTHTFVSGGKEAPASGCPTRAQLRGSGYSLLQEGGQAHRLSANVVAEQGQGENVLFCHPLCPPCVTKALLPEQPLRNPRRPHLLILDKETWSFQAQCPMGSKHRLLEGCGQGDLQRAFGAAICSGGPGGRELPPPRVAVGAAAADCTLIVCETVRQAGAQGEMRLPREAASAPGQTTRGCSGSRRHAGAGVGQERVGARLVHIL